MATTRAYVINNFFLHLNANSDRYDVRHNKRALKSVVANAIKKDFLRFKKSIKGGLLCKSGLHKNIYKPNLIEDSVRGMQAALIKELVKYNTYRAHFSLNGLTPMQYLYMKHKEDLYQSHMM